MTRIGRDPCRGTRARIFVGHLPGIRSDREYYSDTRSVRGGGSPEWRSLTLAFSLSAIVGLFVRLLHLQHLEYELLGTAVYSLARGDASTHWNEALEILHGNWLLRGLEPWKGPGFSYWLATMMKFVGSDPGALRVPQAVLGAVNCGLLAVLASHVISVRWGVAAGLLAAINGTSILFDGELSMATMIVSLVVLSVLTATTAVRDRRRVLFFVSGLCVGFAVVTHASLLLPGTLFAAVVTKSSNWRAGLLLCLGAGIVVGTVALQNSFARNTSVLVSSNGGINLYIGNQPAFDQSGGQTTTAWDRVDSWPSDMGIESPEAQDRYYWGEAWRSAANDPIATLGGLARKTRVLLSPEEVANNFRLYELRSYSGVARVLIGKSWWLTWPWGILAPLGIVGIALSLHRRMGGWINWMILAWIAGIALTMLASFVTARYRVPVQVLLSLYAIITLREAVALIRHRRRAAFLVGAAILSCGVFLQALRVNQTRFPAPIEWHNAVMVSARGHRVAGTAELKRALDAHPSDTILRFSGSKLATQLGDGRLATELLSSVLEIDSIEPDLRFNALDDLATLLYRLGQPEQAREIARDAVRLDIENSTHNGARFFPLSGPPLSTGRARLLVALCDWRLGRKDVATETVRDVVARCGAAGRLRARLDWIEMESNGELRAPSRQVRIPSPGP